VLRKLHKIAYETDSLGCYLEPSPRVRRVARLAMNACGNSVQPVTTPAEGPSEAPAEPTEAPPEGPEAAPAATADRPLTTASALAILGAATPVDLGATLDSPMPDAIVARVNSEPIWLRELLPRVDRQWKQLAAVGSATEQRQIRQALLAAQLQRAIDDRLLRQEAEYCLSSGDFARLVQRTAARDESALEASPVPVSPRASLDSEQRLATEWARSCGDFNQPCSREELAAYYRTHLDEYRAPARVRWEQLTVRFDRVANREAAFATLAFVRAQLQGENPAKPAEAVLSLVETAAVESTSFDALPAGPVGKSLATLSVGHISPVLADERGAHVVRVLERTEPQYPTLDEVADRVRADLLRERGSAALLTHLSQLRKNAAIEILFGTAPTLPPAPSTVAAGQPNLETRPSAAPASSVPSWPTASLPDATPDLQEAMRRHGASSPRAWTR